MTTNVLQEILYDLLLGVSSIVRPALGYMYICIYQNTIKRWINQVYQLDKIITRYIRNNVIYVYIRARSLVVSDLRSETEGSRFESGC